MSNEKVIIKGKVDVKSKVIMIVAAIFCLFFGIIFLTLAANANPSLGFIQTLYAILGWLFLIPGIIIIIVFKIYGTCELQITENSIKGKSIFGKEVVLPMHMVSAYSTVEFLSIIAIATSSGVVKFSLIENYREIGNVLAKKINEKQGNTVTNNKPLAQQPSYIEEIKKLKDLLDAGIITQEEFDAKKKQLLSL